MRATSARREPAKHRKTQVAQGTVVGAHKQDRARGTTSSTVLASTTFDFASLHKYRYKYMQSQE